MMFLPGDHTLDMNITVVNISSLTLCGESSSGYVATVVCNGSVGLSFTSMDNFKIHSLTFTSCGRSFDNHTLNFDKHTLLLDSIKYAVLVNCSFHDNLGTALAVYHSSITLAGNNEFTHNHCDYEGLIPNACVGGGGITALHSNLTLFDNTTFLQNHATFGSAGIHVTNCSLSSTGSIHFINNSLTAPFSKPSGVAIWASASSLNITRTSTFISNSESDRISNDCYCGVIYCHNTSLSFTGTTNFINNSAAYGGAIVAECSTSLSLTGTSNFINNSAAVNGGAIFAGHSTSLSLTGASNFINNSAVHGGAILARDNTSLSFTGTTNFINNSAGYEFGGAICAGYNTSLSFTGTSNFINNSAGVGGGIFLVNSTFSISSNTTVYWESNHAQLGGAIFASDEYNSLVYCTQLDTCTTKGECFFQLPGQNLSNGIDAQFVFITLLTLAVCYMVVQ